MFIRCFRNQAKVPHMLSLIANSAINSSLKKTGLKKLTTIHLDDNYDVVIHGANDIEKGYDEKRQKYFYKLFYDKEK